MMPGLLADCDAWFGLEVGFSAAVPVAVFIAVSEWRRLHEKNR
jgi:hypothetical protein